MRRLRNRGPSSAEIIRQSQVRKLLFKYGAYSRQTAATSSSSLEYSSSSASRSSRQALASSSSALQLATANRRAGQVLHEDADLKLSICKPSQLLATQDLGQMDKGLALAAAQYVSGILSNEEASPQHLKEDFLHALERDWGFAGAENLSLGRIRITIKRRDNDLENIRRRAELEMAELEKTRLEERERAMQSSRLLQSHAVASSSSQMSSSSTTKVVKTRVIKTTKRTVQTVRAA